MEIVDDSGHTIWRQKPQQKVAMSEWGAAIMTDMLKGVIQEGTGRKARVLEGSIAGKTGTTDSYRDALFIGFSPGLAVGVWVGQDAFETLGARETGAKAALPIWMAFMAKALPEQPFEYFPIPDEVSQVRMDPVSGQISTTDTPQSITVLIRKKSDS